MSLFSTASILSFSTSFCYTDCHLFLFPFYFPTPPLWESSPYIRRRSRELQTCCSRTNGRYLFLSCLSTFFWISYLGVFFDFLTDLASERASFFEFFCLCGFLTCHFFHPSWIYSAFPLSFISWVTANIVVSHAAAAGSDSTSRTYLQAPVQQACTKYIQQGGEILLVMT